MFISYLKEKLFLNFWRQNNQSEPNPQIVYRNLIVPESKLNEQDLNRLQKIILDLGKQLNIPKNIMQKTKIKVSKKSNRNDMVVTPSSSPPDKLIDKKKGKIFPKYFIRFFPNHYTITISEFDALTLLEKHIPKQDADYKKIKNHDFSFSKILSMRALYQIFFLSIQKPILKKPDEVKALIAHELGHIIDFETNNHFFEKFFGKFTFFEYFITILLNYVSFGVFFFYKNKKSELFADRFAIRDPKLQQGFYRYFSRVAKFETAKRTYYKEELKRRKISCIVRNINTFKYDLVRKIKQLKDTHLSAAKRADLAIYSV